MSYDQNGRQVPQKGANGGAFVIIVDMDGNPVSIGGGSGTDLTPIINLVGNVSGNPTLNTVLGRLKDITDRLSAPKYTTVTITQASTNADGTTFTAFPSVACEILEVVNDTGTDIEYRRGATGNTMIIPTGQTRQIVGLSNANGIQVRRKDVATTPVVVRAEALKL